MYLLRAKITEDEFYTYVNKLNLTPHTSTREYGYGFILNWHPHEHLTDDQLDWWTPTENFDSTYVYDGGSWWRYAKYEDGYIFVVSFNI